MTRVLHLDASPRSDRSKSRPVAAEFLSALPSTYQITSLDMWSLDLPSMGGDMIQGRYSLIMGEPVDPDIQKAWDDVEGVAVDFLDHDMLVVSTPMWNFGLPYPLKHYIDVITQPGMTFRNDAAGNVEGLAAGKTAIIIAASAMPITPDGPLAALDFQQRYLEQWLGFIGVTDLHAIRVAPTYGDDAVVAEAVTTARREANELAVRLAAVNPGNKPD